VHFLDATDTTRPLPRLLSFSFFYRNVVLGHSSIPSV
jgi:hypothetical protein